MTGCPTCHDAGRQGYCAPRRCYCRHKECPAYPTDPKAWTKVGEAA